METNVLHQGNPVNDPTIKKSVDHSNFKLKRRVYTTHRFGEYTPNFFMEVVPRDVIKGSISHTLRTLNLKSPLMSDLKMNRDFFFVPMQAILPFNWDKIAAIPTHGDDVPSDVYPVVESFPLKALNFVDVYAKQFRNDTADYKVRIQAALKFCIFGEMFFSTGSLLKLSGYSLDSCFRGSAASTDGVRSDVFDDYFNDIIKRLFFGTDGVTPNWNFISVNFVDSAGVTSSSKTYSNLKSLSNVRSMLEDLRDHPCFIVVSSSVNVSSNVDEQLDFIKAQYFNGPSTDSLCYVLVQSIVPDIPLNYSRLVAYQIAMAHYCTNDKVDFVFSAELYRQLFGTLFADSGNAFEYNGIRCVYDYLSGANIDACFSSRLHIFVCESAFALIFSFKHSLRYVDYFTGSRPQPLAVGDTRVSVQNSSFSIMDSVKQTLFARLLNAVARTGAKIANQMKDVHGAEAPHDWHDPMWLGHIDSDVYGSEVENTGSEQFDNSDGNSITTNLRSSNGEFAFSYQNDGVYGIIVCTTYYDIPRAYMHTIDKQMFTRDRFDMFFNQLQYQGDQILDLAELDAGTLESGDKLDDKPFGYTLRDMQYKQSFDVASGGFIKALPSWSFLADYERWSDRDFSLLARNISPSYIRSRNTELDRFFQSLSGLSLGTYFHFILKEYYVVSADRNMAYAPTIL